MTQQNGRCFNSKNDLIGLALTLLKSMQQFDSKYCDTANIQSDMDMNNEQITRYCGKYNTANASKIISTLTDRPGFQKGNLKSINSQKVKSQLKIQ